MQHPMNRILILGSGGSGKTTFARKLAAKTGLPLHHLDSLYWKPGWTKPETAEFRQRVADIVDTDQWIVDGSYFDTLNLRAPRADCIIFLDISRYVCLWNMLKRRVLYAHFTGKTRPGLPEGCPEKIYFSFLKWVWHYPERDRPKVLKTIGRYRNRDCNVLIFKNYATMEAYLEQIFVPCT